MEREFQIYKVGRFLNLPEFPKTNSLSKKKKYSRLGCDVHAVTVRSHGYK